jgi:signal transduction histidine kinase/CheY-like chemotaxis protein
MLLPYLIIAFLIAVAGFLAVLLVKARKSAEILKTELTSRDSEIEKLNTTIERLRDDFEKQVDEKMRAIREDVTQHEKSDQTLKKALKRAEEANFLKNAFLSNISQEIRTPLNTIIGFSSLLEAEISLLENKELFDYARAISESGDRLLNLLNNILDMSRIESHHLQISLKPANISTIVANTTQFFIFKANEKRLKVNLKVGDVPDAMVDEKSLTRVVSAIVENAIKHTGNGFINISTEFIRERNEISVRIKDSGEGIDPAYLPMIFDPFRNDNTGFSKDAQGAGLGLPLAKSLIEMMRGRIVIDSAKGAGTTVTLFIPCERKSDDTGPKPVYSKKEKFRALQGLDIFIVEDDLMNKIVLYEMTKSLGSVIAAINGDETMRIIEQHHNEGKVFDVMLFDINLPPPWDGTRLMQEIRKKWKAYKDIPFIAQTAYAMSGDKEKLLDAGFDDYISKPINQQELYSIIKNQLNKL